MDAKSKIPVALYIRKITLFSGFLIFTGFHSLLFSYIGLSYLFCNMHHFPSIFSISDWCFALVFILFYYFSKKQFQKFFISWKKKVKLHFTTAHGTKKMEKSIVSYPPEA